MQITQLNTITGISVDMKILISIEALFHAACNVFDPTLVWLPAKIHQQLRKESLQAQLKKAFANTTYYVATGSSHLNFQRSLFEATPFYKHRQFHYTADQY